MLTMTNWISYNLFKEFQTIITTQRFYGYMQCLLYIVGVFKVLVALIELVSMVSHEELATNNSLYNY